MLVAKKLSKRYNDVTALDSLKLTVQPCEVFCLLGANGAGKTTTINLFLNFIDPTSGTATINGLGLSSIGTIVANAARSAVSIRTAMSCRPESDAASPAGYRERGR